MNKNPLISLITSYPKLIGITAVADSRVDLTSFAATSVASAGQAVSPANVAGCRKRVAVGDRVALPLGAVVDHAVTAELGPAVVVADVEGGSAGCIVTVDAPVVYRIAQGIDVRGRRRGRHIMTRNRDRTAIRLFQARDKPQRRRFSHPSRSHKCRHMGHP